MVDVSFLQPYSSFNCDMHVFEICDLCKLLLTLWFFFLDGFKMKAELFEDWLDLVERLIWSELLFRGLPGLDSPLDEPEERDSESGPIEFLLLLVLHWSRS